MICHAQIFLKEMLPDRKTSIVVFEFYGLYLILSQFYCLCKTRFLKKRYSVSLQDSNLISGIFVTVCYPFEVKFR